MVTNHNHRTDSKTEADVPLLKNLAVPIETLPNLRRVDQAGKLYRSSRQDLLSQADAKSVSHMGIRSVIDFRSKSEYKFAKGDKILDHNSDVVEVLVPKGRGRGSLRNTKGVPVKPFATDKQRKLQVQAIQSEKKANTNELSSQHDGPYTRKRYLIDFFKINYAWTVFSRIPLYKRLYSLIFLIVDVIFRTHFRNFIRFFAKETLNPAGLLSSYTDMLELSATQICLALRILSDPANLPALVSCAHGKDRTGIVVALVLALLGKPDDYIVQEYALSEEGLNPIRSRVHQEIVERTSMDESFTHARQETMMGMLDYIHETYGTVPNYLESIGFTREDQLRLVQTFQE